jgi:hypothetical protein
MNFHWFHSILSNRGSRFEFGNQSRNSTRSRLRETSTLDLCHGLRRVMELRDSGKIRFRLGGSGQSWRRVQSRRSSGRKDNHIWGHWRRHEHLSLVKTSEFFRDFKLTFGLYNVESNNIRTSRGDGIAAGRIAVREKDTWSRYNFELDFSTSRLARFASVFAPRTS